MHLCWDPEPRGGFLHPLGDINQGSAEITLLLGCGTQGRIAFILFLTLSIIAGTILLLGCGTQGRIVFYILLVTRCAVFVLLLCPARCVDFSRSMAGAREKR